MPDATPYPSPPLPRSVLRRLIARQAMPMVLIALVFWLMRDRVAGFDVGGILAATRAISPLAWAAAVLATMVSFWAVGRYDAVIHRLLVTDVSGSAARRAGIVAIATSQTVGFGLLTGTLARWRMLPDLSLWQSARITMTVSVSFMAGLAVIGSIAVLWVGAAVPIAPVFAWAVLLGAAVFAMLSLWRPRRLLRHRLPPVRAQAAILGLVALDTAAAALALYVLLPGADMPGIMTFFAVFLVALGAGMIGATPGGVGPFEFVCLACLPSVPEASLLAAIAGFRLVYYGLPGACAAYFLVVARQDRKVQTAKSVDLMIPGSTANAGSPLDRILFHAKRAEAQLIRQGELDLLCQGQMPMALAAATGQSLIVLGDPLRRDLAGADLLQIVTRAATDRCLTPCLYKCSARVALAARRAGWQVMRASHEAWIAPDTFDPARPACRQLRRQLRKAHVAGLHAVEAGAFVPLDEMAEIADIWAKQRGGARGFSLGRFTRELVHRQRVFLCYDAQRRLIAFATFHEAKGEWTLDQMCQTRLTPPGAMHSLIVTALAAAKRRGCPRLSLAAVPRSAPAWLPRHIGQWVDARSGAVGLRRFKSAYDPNCEPLYMAAPSRFGMVLGGLDLMDRITRPGPRRKLAVSSGENS